MPSLAIFAPECIFDQVLSLSNISPSGVIPLFAIVLANFAIPLADPLQLALGFSPRMKLSLPNM